ncbi:type II toxin-antitoxin system RelE/ParE family toxin [Phytohabitans suffuscus]|uniref:Toxin RelE n=1 Tax=Phytohabitans suffuscus TaxID=624315 RepID=A0A6F8YDG9_9ACTN|nr:type II toxin-antitoxin system RelE/ParE family toxin [Phytohabitans suffuscus]BCB84107.1 hypothetical protein Psuf_014200 [Phytohabitans suffuscus]
MDWSVVRHPQVDDDLVNLPPDEVAAIINAMKKLEAIGPTLGYPHSSQVKGADDLRELRPRQGRSPWRAFYRQIGQHLVIAAIGPEAEQDKKGFKRAIKVAEQRLSDLGDE